MPDYECYEICENAWNTYVQKSLYNLITTGKGEPNGTGKPQTDDEQKLAAADFTTTFFVNEIPAEVIAAVNNVRGWWQGSIEGNMHEIGDEFTYKMKDFHYSKQRLVEVVPGKRVVWLVTDSKLTSFPNQSEWTGTKMIFDITEINNKTQLRFTHQGLVPDIECYGSCTNAWSKLIRESLFSLVTTGKGKNVF